MGRTAQFTETLFDQDQPVGQIVPALITGSEGDRLRAAVRDARAA